MEIEYKFRPFLNGLPNIWANFLFPFCKWMELQMTTDLWFVVDLMKINIQYILSTFPHGQCTKVLNMNVGIDKKIHIQHCIKMVFGLNSFQTY